VLPNDAQAVPFWLAVRPKHAGEDEKLPSVAPGTVSDFSPAGRFGDQRIMGAVAREDEARAKARDEAVDPFHGLPIPQTLASKISSSAIERLAVRRHFKPKDQRPYRPIPDRPGITGGPWQMRPLSRGYAGSVSPSS